MKKQLLSKIVIIVVVSFLLILAPQHINMPSQSATAAICTGIAIDTQQNNLSLTAQILLPMAGGQYEQSMSLVTSDGVNLMDAFDNLEALVGKRINMSHCFYIIIGDEFSKTNLASNLDYLIRGHNTGNNTIILQSKSTAKELIELAANANSSGVDSIQTLLKYNDKYLSSSEANLKSFYNDYLSPHKTSCITLLDKSPDSKEQSNNSSGGGQESSNSSGSSSSNIIKEKIKNDGSCSVYYKGKCATILSPEERQYFNWLDSKLNNTPILLENISDKQFESATLGYSIVSKKMKWQYKFINNKPCIFIDYDLNLRPEMFLQDKDNLPNKSYINDSILEAINTKVETEVKLAMKKQKEYGFDIFDFYKKFDIHCHNEWKQYILSLDDKDNYISSIEVYTNVKCKSQI